MRLVLRVYNQTIRLMSTAATTNALTATTDRSYQSALRQLYTLVSNAADLQQWVDRRVEDRNVTSIAPMREYLRRIDCDISSLRVVHIAGTKGKGSTSAFVERILRECGLRTGLYTSPHLRFETERFRINGAAVSDELFAEHFWKCYDRLSASCTPDLGMPTWFRMMTLLCLDMFVAQRLDVAVIEVGVGGRADATTVVDPVVCGVASLGFDHMNVLGYTLPEIAREKAGIFKRGVPAFSCSQRDDAAQTLVGVASDVGAPLAFVAPSTSLLRLGIGGAHQFTNAAVAVSLATAFLARTGRSRLLLPSLSHVAEFATRGLRQPNVPLSVGISAATLPAAFVRGLERCRWPGRSQIVVDPRNDAIRYAIDGAHTVESMEVAGAWFGAQRRTKGSPAYVLLFNCANTKQPEKLLSCVASSVGVEFDAVIFTTYRTDARNGVNRERGETPWPANTPADVDQTLPNLAFQQQLADCYRSLRPNVEISCVHSVREAIDRIAELSARTRRPVDVLATGSLYLAGAMLEALEVDTRNL